MIDVLYIVVPCFNEEEVLPVAAERLGGKLLSLIEREVVSPKSRILFVDDGSKDNTWEIISGLHSVKNSLVSGLRLASNVGHQNALLAGLYKAVEVCDVTITIDADLQQDIDAIDSFLDKYYEGNDIVFGIRSNRRSDTLFKKTSALFFYKTMSAFGVKINKNHADYRLLSKKAILALMDYKEVNLFLRGIIPLVGFKTDVVYFDVKDRFAGKSKYSLAKMTALAFNGITSFSIRPIRAIALVGLLSFLVSIIITIYHLWFYLFGGIPVEGWTTVVISIWALGGLQLVAIGIVGEYIGKTYLETKERPKFTV